MKYDEQLKELIRAERRDELVGIAVGIVLSVLVVWLGM
jgi:hypothetical protein